MVDKNSPIFIACRPTGIIAILLAFGIAILLSNNASAANSFSNNGFETGDFTSWSYSDGSVLSSIVYDGTYSANIHKSGTGDPGYINGYFGQSIDLTNVDSVTFWYNISTYSGYWSFSYYLDAPTAENIYPILNSESPGTTGSWVQYDINTTSISGSHVIGVYCSASVPHPPAPEPVAGEISIFFDNFVAEADVDSVEWNQSSYSVDDTGSMAYSISEYDPGTYDYSIDIFEGSSFMSYCHLSSSDGDASYTFSGVVEPVTYYAKLTKRVNGSSVPLVMTTDTCTVGPSDVSIVFNQSIYGPDDLVSISYYNCPNGSKIILQDDIIPHQVSNTWVDISGNGSVSYQLSNADANRIFYAKVYSVSDIVLASDSMQIDDISSGYCQIHGGIYDSQDYHPLIGTVFIGDSYSDVVGYDDYGAYSIIVPWGTYNISAVVSSYLTYDISDVVISGTDYDLNMFLFVNGTTTHVFRGSVTDADTNTAVDNVLIQVYNDTFDEYDFTSQSGVWVVNGLTSGANYTLHATKDDYHPYTYSFMYDPGDFYHNFMMLSVVVEDDVIEDVLEDDESMTEYYNEKFRDFAPTIWGFFMLMCLLFLMSILTSFNNGGKRR